MFDLLDQSQDEGLLWARTRQEDSLFFFNSLLTRAQAGAQMSNTARVSHTPFLGP